MANEESVKEWKRLYDSIMDPEEIEKNKREAERKARIEARKADTGL